MGLRLWIRTIETPVFTEKTKMHYLDQSAKIDDFNFWFFQDEWCGDWSLYRMAGFAGEGYISPEEDKKEIFKKFTDDNYAFIDALIKVSTDDIGSYFDNQWERPSIYWTNFKIITTAYLEAKRDYLKSIRDAGIASIYTDKDLNIGSGAARFYNGKAEGPARRITITSGRVTILE